mmetsp:Transcript_1101/g.1775  ORF Transcript_1101/g.1775 Transcript_1101/m.1775 type:complete len:80 (+) Transcript_1101:415-654(+)
MLWVVAMQYSRKYSLQKLSRNVLFVAQPISTFPMAVLMIPERNDDDINSSTNGVSRHRGPTLSNLTCRPLAVSTTLTAG